MKPFGGPPVGSLSKFSLKGLVSLVQGTLLSRRVRISDRFAELALPGGGGAFNESLDVGSSVNSRRIVVALAEMPPFRRDIDQTSGEGATNAGDDAGSPGAAARALSPPKPLRRAIGSDLHSVQGTRH
jgi:hypothetical protein